MPCSSGWRRRRDERRRPRKAVVPDEQRLRDGHRRKRGDAGRADDDRGTLAAGVGVRQVLFRRRARHHRRNADGHRPGAGDGPHRRARWRRSRDAVPARARAEDRLGCARPRRATDRRASHAQRSDGHPRVLSDGVSSAIRSYVLSARGLLQGLNRFDLETITVVADRGLLLLLGTLVLVSGFGLYGLSIAFVVARLLMFVVVTIIVKRVT